MTEVAAALVLSRSYLDGLTAETRLMRRGQVLCAVYGALCRRVAVEAAAALEDRFVGELARHVAAPAGLDEATTRKALRDQTGLVAVDEFAALHATEEERVWEAAHRLGEALDMLLAVEKAKERKSIGSYFTPKQVAQTVVDRCWSHVLSLPSVQAGQLPRVLDPACGGGAFLLEAVRRIALYAGSLHAGPTAALDRQQALCQAVRCAHGIDVSPFAVATARAALRLLAPDLSKDEAAEQRFFVGDALLDAETPQGARALDELRQQGHAPLHVRAVLGVFGEQQRGFDWIVGNPPWVAFQGRATQPISGELRAFYRQRYRSFSGYPTTQGMFAQRSAELAPHGVIGLLVPSSLADLDGYKNTRAAVTELHVVAEPLLEFGQDAFESVVQPCFGLVAAPRSGETPLGPDADPSRRWVLAERPRLADAADRVAPPACLAIIDRLPRLPKETFGELGFQSNTRVVQELFLRSAAPSGVYTLGLLEGRCVQEFKQQAPRVFLAPNQQRLLELRARLRDAASYEKVDFVVRQTAAFTIAARHNGQAFRNSLIAGYAQPELDADLLVGLLNSALFRCLHLSRQRDARQATFPQVKLAHLRALPAPPEQVSARKGVRDVSAAASRAGGLTEGARRRLDQAVFELFGLSDQQARDILDYLRARAPRALGAAEPSR